MSHFPIAQLCMIANYLLYDLISTLGAMESQLRYFCGCRVALVVPAFLVCSLNMGPSVSKQTSSLSQGTSAGLTHTMFSTLTSLLELDLGKSGESCFDQEK